MHKLQKSILGEVATFLYTALYAMGGMENGYETFADYTNGKVINLSLPHGALPDSRKACEELKSTIAAGLKAIELKHGVRLTIRPDHVEYGCYRHTLTATILNTHVTPYDGIDGVVRAPRPQPLDKTIWTVP